MAPCYTRLCSRRACPPGLDRDLQVTQSTAQPSF